MAYPSHIYPIQISPPEFGKCDKPVAWFGYVQNNIFAVCEDGHLIRGWVVLSSEAKSRAERKAKRFKVEARPY